MGLDAVLGMAEVAAWAEAPARAIGRFDVRQPPKSLDEMWACATNETERQAIRTAMFGSVMDVVDRFLPDREKHAQVRSMLAFLAVNSTYRGPYSPGQRAVPGLRPGLAGRRHHVQGQGGIGTMSDHLLGLFEQHGGELRRHVKVAGIVTSGGRVDGVALADGEVVTAPVVVSNLDPTATFTQLLDRDALPDAFARRVDAIDHRAAYFQMHFALNGLPEYAGPYEDAQRGRPQPQRDVLRDGRADAGRLRGLRARARPGVALVQPVDPDAAGPRPGPAGQARGQQLRLLRPDRRRPTRTRPASATRWPTASWPRSPAWPRTSPT